MIRVEWVATSFGALDLRDTDLGSRGLEIVVVPTLSLPPVFLFGKGASLWRRLIESPLDQVNVDGETLTMLEEFESMGIASRSRPDSTRLVRLDRLDRPWLVSPLHEVVYALLENVATAEGIDIVFIKGPTLHAQGLRDREHSGDVDCWVRPGDDIRLARAMVSRGWTPLFSAFSGTGVFHALTLRSGEWGCAIDVHCRFPGMALEPIEAFDIVRADAETRYFGSVPVLTPNTRVHAVIAALHELRPYLGAAPSETQVDNARSALRGAGIGVVAEVDRLGAGYVLRDALRDVFPQMNLRSTGQAVPDDWAWRSRTSWQRQYLAALRRVPPRQRFAVAWRLVWPDARQMRVAHDIQDVSVVRLSMMRFRRIVRSCLGLFSR